MRLKPKFQQRDINLEWVASALGGMAHHWGPHMVGIDVRGVQNGAVAIWPVRHALHPQARHGRDPSGVHPAVLCWHRTGPSAVKWSVC